MKQLDASMQPNELDILRDSRQEVSEFLRLGRKWGFFELAEKTSAKAGREVLANAHMPESNLAALIGGRNAMSIAAIEKMVDEGLGRDPKYVASLLISRINDLYRHESAEHGTVALTSGSAAEKLTREQDPGNYLRWVNTPAPVHAVPAWFHIIDKYCMGPADLEMIYTLMDEGSVAVVADATSMHHEALMKATDTAA
jgi:hypothetical protein